MQPPLSPDRLFELYKIAIDEYRFNVKLGWDRAMYYMVFNTGLISVAAGLLKNESTPLGYIFIALIFGFGILCSAIGRKAVLRNHEYYRRTILKKTLFEDMLGFAAPIPDYQGQTLSIGTTPGQGDYLEMISDPQRYIDRKIRSGAVVYWVSLMLSVLAGLNLVGAVFSLWLAVHPAQKTLAQPPLITPVLSGASSLRSL